MRKGANWPPSFIVSLFLVFPGRLLSFSAPHILCPIVGPFLSFLFLLILSFLCAFALPLLSTILLFVFCLPFLSSFYELFAHNIYIVYSVALVKFYFYIISISAEACMSPTITSSAASAILLFESHLRGRSHDRRERPRAARRSQAAFFC